MLGTAQTSPPPAPTPSGTGSVQPLWMIPSLIGLFVLTSALLTIARRFTFPNTDNPKPKPKRPGPSPWQQSADRIPLEDSEIKEEPDRF